MHLILTGATGLVGSAVLDAMLKTKDITRISILTRRPVAMATASNDPRVNIILHSDFEKYDPSVLKQLEGAKGCVWALGISQTQVGKEEYVRITKTYAVEAAKAFSNLGKEGEEFRFVYVSGEGATHNPGRFSQIFARVKGETEMLLSAIPNLHADSVRPAGVDAGSHAAIQPYVPNPGLAYKAAMVVLGPVIKNVWTGMHSPTEMLGPFFVQLAMGRLDGKLKGTGAERVGSGWVVGNVGIRRVMGWK